LYHGIIYYPPTGSGYERQGSEQPYGYTGYRYDEIGNTWHANAREYRAEIGRFTSKDEDAYLQIEQPQSLNQYVYCLANPLRYIDPLGHEAGEVQKKLKALGIRETLIGGIQSLYTDNIQGKLYEWHTFQIETLINLERNEKIIKESIKGSINDLKNIALNRINTEMKQVNSKVTSSSLLLKERLKDLKESIPKIQLVMQPEKNLKYTGYEERMELERNSHYTGKK